MGDAPPSDNRLCEILNKSFARGRNPSVALLGGKIVSFDREAQSMRMEFAATPALDNGNAQVMGGFLGCARAQFLRPDHSLDVLLPVLSRRANVHACRWLLAVCDKWQARCGGGEQTTSRLTTG
jgi:hypothetical protein